MKTDSIYGMLVGPNRGRASAPIRENPITLAALTKWTTSSTRRPSVMLRRYRKT